MFKLRLPRFSRAVMAAGFLCSSVWAYAQADLEPWTAPDKVLFAAITQGGSVGYVDKSTDGGFTWEEVMYTPRRVSGLAYGDGQLVAVGGYIMVSEDMGENWEVHEITHKSGNNVTSGSTYFRAVAYGNGVFLVVGDSGHILYSNDGKDWLYVQGDDSDPHYKDGGFDYEMQHARDVMYVGNNRFVVSGGSFSGVVTTFVTDGTKVELDKQFRIGAFDSGQLQKIGFDGESTIVIMSNSHSSEWGMTTTAVSTDLGDSWAVAAQPAKQQAYPVAYGNGIWSALSPFGDIYTSTNIGEKGWTASGSNSSRMVNDMIFANGRFLLVGHDSKRYISLDGKEWTEAFADSNIGYNMHDVIYIDTDPTNSNEEPPAKPTWQRVMNWAESLFADLFPAAGVQNLEVPPAYQVRYYPASGTYLAYNADDKNLYGFNQSLWGLTVQNFGNADSYLPMAEEAGF